MQSAVPFFSSFVAVFKCKESILIFFLMDGRMVRVLTKIDKNYFVVGRKTSLSTLVLINSIGPLYIDYPIFCIYYYNIMYYYTKY